jgi:GTPase SAR1 family protein
MSRKLKLVLLGPKQSGKSTIANFLSGNSNTLLNENYDPTYGLRILETDLTELWDSSGDSK